MGKFDRKAQMMDAGTVLFRCEGGFGSAIGTVKGKMLPYGRVWTASELDAESLPTSARGCDLLLDWSTPWRTRYISCKCSASGDSWAATFKEGNRSGKLRAAFFLALIASLLVSCLFIRAWWIPLVIFLSLALLYIWITPSRLAVRTLRSIQDSLKE